MGLFGFKNQEQKLSAQKKDHFKRIDKDFTEPYHTEEYKNGVKAGWLASRGVALAEQGDYKNAEHDVFEAMEMAPLDLMCRVSAIEIYWKMHNLQLAAMIIENTPKQSLEESYSVMPMFSFYDRAAAVYADMGNKKKYLEYAKKALKILKSEEYTKEEKQASAGLGIPEDDIQAFISDIEAQIKEFSK